MQAQIRLRSIDAMPTTAAFAELIDDGIFHSLRDEAAMGELAFPGHRVYGQRPARRQVLRPVQRINASIQRLLIGGGKFGQRQQNATGQARPQTSAVGKREIATERHAGQRLARIQRTQRSQLVAQQVFQTLRTGREITAHAAILAKKSANCARIRGKLAPKR
ncbi:hypothetical protein RF55_24674 [Lasius niger]|uniref:Uncharacterized protein n=1 Tax=Lasius niger TaxID=67767 RepID=A0A0J7MMW8_LASNI|nr:hypothetical protein RF55_24674 [Lasius niger]